MSAHDFESGHQKCCYKHTDMLEEEITRLRAALAIAEKAALQPYCGHESRLLELATQLASLQSEANDLAYQRDVNARLMKERGEELAEAHEETRHLAETHMYCEGLIGEQRVRAEEAQREVERLTQKLKPYLEWEDVDECFVASHARLEARCARLEKYLDQALEHVEEHQEGCLFCGEGEIVDGDTTPEHRAECWYYIVKRDK